jgi:3-hydroxymyristoyl/3-hydroxydecanoyl-(acyl carrier protein) dehydratase
MLAQFGLAPDGTPFVRELAFGEPRTDGPVVAVDVTIPERYAWFLGHFDGYPILAGAVQLLELVQPIVDRARPDFGPVHELRRLKFTGRITPGDTVTVTLRFAEHERACDFEIAKGTTRCSGGRLGFYPS